MAGLVQWVGCLMPLSIRFGGAGGLNGSTLELALV